MRRRILTGAAVLVATFLLATNPVVADAARTITGKDIENGTVTGKDVKNRSLSKKDFRKGQLAQGQAGPAGPAGATGATGATGPAGADGVVATGWADYDFQRDSGFVTLQLPVDGTYGDVLAIGSGPSQRSGPVTVTGSSRLFMSANAYIQNSDAVGRTLRCFFELRPVGGTPRQASFISFDSGVPSFGTKTVAFTGSAPVSAGTYNVAFRCATQLSNAGGRVYFANLSVLAVRAAS